MNKSDLNCLMGIGCKASMEAKGEQRLALKPLRRRIGHRMKAIMLAGALISAATTSAQAQFDPSQVAAFVSGATLNGEMVAKLLNCGYRKRAEDTARKFSAITLMLLGNDRYVREGQQATANFEAGKANVYRQYSGTPPQRVCAEALDIDRRVNGR